MTQGLPSGTLLYHNQYRIEKVLGQGGFGITYLAHDFSLDRKVAIKEFFPKEFCDRDTDATCLTSGTHGHSDYVKKLKDKFLNEARHIGRLNHPNIIKIHSAFEENNTAYYVMEYIEGENLSEKVKKNGPLKEEVAVEYIEKVGEALEYMHKQKFNHLDVKPANIMVDSSSNTPILIDFGLSTHYETGEELPTGTMPPGISNGYSPLALYDFNRDKSFNPQHDVYSLSATLYFLVSGITPPSAIQLSSYALTFHSNFPENLKEPVKNGMSIQSENRYPSIKNFINKISPEKDPEPVFAANTITRQIVGNTDLDGLYFKLNEKKIPLSISSTDFFGLPLLFFLIFILVVNIFSISYLHTENLIDPYIRFCIIFFQIFSIISAFGVYNFKRLRIKGYLETFIGTLGITIIATVLSIFICFQDIPEIVSNLNSNENKEFWDYLGAIWDIVTTLFFFGFIIGFLITFIIQIIKTKKKYFSLFNKSGSYIPLIIVLLIILGGLGYTYFFS